MKTVAIIPARAGSKGLPGKNLKMLNGKPLIVYTIESALNSKVLDKVIVTTDSQEIIDVAKKYGAEIPFIRPSYLAQDTTHTPPVIDHAVKYLESERNYKINTVVTLQPTSPLRNEVHIRESVNKFLNSGLDSLISVKESFPPWWMLKLNNHKAVPIIKLESGEDPYLLERQQLPKVYQANGAIYITKRERLYKECKLVFQDSLGIYVMNEESSLDVDTPLDFKIIEFIMKERNEKSFSRK